MLVRLYGQENAGEARYSPPKCMGCLCEKLMGKPKNEAISTSMVECQNLTMRMNMRRFTRLTNAFSKKIENLGAEVALHFMYYNFVGIHQTLRISPAMAAGVTTHLWEIFEIIDLLEKKQSN